MDRIEIIFKTATLFIAIWAAYSAHKSRKRADASAASSKASSQVALEALNLERERFEHEKADAKRLEREKIITDGIDLFKEKGWRPGLKRWLARYEGLRKRDDFMDILRSVMGATGNDSTNLERFLETAIKEGIISE